MASPECIVEVFAFIGGAYGQRFPTPTETDMGVWAKLLEQTDDEQLYDAVVAHCSVETWPPTPADLLKRCGRRQYVDRSHRPYEIEAGEPAPRDPKIGELLKRTRAQLNADVIDLDERRSS